MTYIRGLYGERKRAKVCVSCGGLNDRLPKVNCSKCAEYQANYQKNRTDLAQQAKAKLGINQQSNPHFKEMKRDNYVEKSTISQNQKQQVEINTTKQTVNQGFIKGFELGRQLGRKKLYEEINELVEELVIDTIEADDLKNILKLVKA